VKDSDSRTKLSALKRHSVIGLPVAATDYSGAIDWILDKAAHTHRAVGVEAANAHVAALSRHDAQFAQSMARFDLILPDGMPLVWAINAELEPGQALKERVYGPTLMLKTLEKTSGSGLGHFLLGGDQDTLDKLTTRFATEFPATRIAGTYSPPFGPWDDQEQARINNRILDSGARLIWVALGCPKQEHWIARNLDILPAGVYFGIGAAFAFHAGKVRQAPAQLQRLGLEWAYRLAMEPRRLWRRYFIYNNLFLFHWLRDRMKD
jgi:N-acetylglucosaminyldiphosphoundecaprenol N-acetyl-beta-D-mannosaminyltransferase